MNNQTFAMIKPDAIKNGHLGKIIDHLLNDRFCYNRIEIPKNEQRSS